MPCLTACGIAITLAKLPPIYIRCLPPPLHTVHAGAAATESTGDKCAKAGSKRTWRDDTGQARDQAEGMAPEEDAPAPNPHFDVSQFSNRAANTSK